MKKLYYKIGEVSEILGESKSTLRFWESEFDEISPRREAGKRRLYTNSDIEILKKIKYLLHTEGYSIKGAKRAMREKKPEMDILNRIKKIKKILED